MNQQTLKQRMSAGETVLGCFLSLGSANTAEIMGRAGYDWSLIDLEHGAGDERDALAQMHALSGTGSVPIVRVESNARQRAHRVLDLGAQGIMFPRIDTPDDARAAVAAVRYPPHGVRGVAFSNRACEFGSAFQSYMASSLTSLLCIVQIETRESVGNVEEIAAIDGVDVLFVGPSDLSQSFGILGQFTHPDFTSAIERTAAAASKAGKQAGILLPKPDDLGYYRGLGFRFIASGSDGVLLNNAARALVKGLRSSL